MGCTLIISEKRETAEKIAKALDENGSPTSYSEEGVTCYEARCDGRTLRIVPAIGHLYTIAPVQKGYGYPILDVEWVPAYRFNKRLGHTKRWIAAISKAAEDASDFVSATDYDVEGEVIGYTILRFACGGKEREAKRMVFSTLTRAELRKAFHNLSPTIDFKLAEAGETRHVVDFLWGINVSRALTLSLRNQGRGFAKLSAGRVQGPTLGFVAEREREINSFVPTPYWRISATIEVNGIVYRVEYAEPRIATLKEAKRIVELCKSKEGTVENVTVRTHEETPPPPFNLENLQSESYRIFRQSPSQTLRQAEALYLGALISYPRTSSEKVPPTVDYAEIINSLGQLQQYQHLATQLLKQSRALAPLQGRGEDPAHPAIYPTGDHPRQGQDRRSALLFDLVVKRFMSSFAPSALVESVRISITLNGESFYLTGRRILEEGWFSFYSPYVQSEESPAPAFREGDRVKFREVSVDEAYTAPPPRFNYGSLLRVMEEHELGTKATRANIIDTLSDRGYVSGDRITATELGLGVYDTLHNYSPALVSVEFTRDLEHKMETIRQGKGRMDMVVSEASHRLSQVLQSFKENEAAVAESISKALYAYSDMKRTIGACPVCRGGHLMVVASKKTGKRFAGCSGYRDGKCSATFSLPQPPYRIWTTKRTCRSCNWPTITVKSPNRGRPWRLCLNPGCPAKILRTRQQ
jgi:DNA topoisomerase-1